MISILYITRPVTRKKDEGSKNFMVDLAGALSPRDFAAYFLSVVGESPRLPKHIHTIPIHPRDSFGLRTKIRILLYLFKRKTDIIHTSFVVKPAGSIVLKCIIWALGLRVVQTIPSLHVQSTRMIRQIIYGRHVVCMSSKTKKALIRAGIERVHKIPPGISIETFAPRKKMDKIILAGELYRMKSFDIVSGIIPLLRRAFPKFVIVLAFRTENKPHEEHDCVEKLKEKYPESPTLQYLSVIADPPKLLGESKMLIHPAHSTRGKFDYPLVLLESLSCKTPVLISPVKPMSELSRYPGVFMPSSNTPESFVSQARRVFRNYSAASSGARETARMYFSIETASKKYQKIYEKTV